MRNHLCVPVHLYLLVVFTPLYCQDIPHFIFDQLINTLNELRISSKFLLQCPPPLYGDRWGIGGDLTHRMCQIPHPSITIQCQIPTLYIHTRICAGTRANACAGQKPHPWGVISWRIPYQAPPLSPTGGGGA